MPSFIGEARKTIIKPGSAEARQLELVITLLGGSQPSCLLPSCPHLSSVNYPQCLSSALTVWKGLPPDPASDPTLQVATYWGDYALGSLQRFSLSSPVLRVSLEAWGLRG